MDAFNTGVSSNYEQACKLRYDWNTSIIAGVFFRNIMIKNVIISELSIKLWYNRGKEKVMYGNCFNE